jgi:hypothetical protein
MSSQPSHEFLHQRPLILAGPILQRTEPTAVTVWVALQQPCQVSLTVYETTRQGTVLGTPQLRGDRETFALGQSLHLVAITARSIAGTSLVSDRIYAYDLQFHNLVTQSQQTLEEALCSELIPTVSISYFAHQKPTFALPPARLQDLRIVQGSCRKAHGKGFDALTILDCLLEETAHQPCRRPHQLFLTGDQIYGDDVADPYLWAASVLGDRLLGWEEKLPVRRPGTAENDCTPSQLPPGQRAQVATQQAGFTAGLSNKQDHVNSHLLSLGEYYAAYILAWSPVCWSTQFPRGNTITPDRKASQRWDQEVQQIQQFIHTLWKVRRSLANIPAYSIFDDHDVTDDWNLNQAWCLRVLGRSLGRRAVQNALLAYAVFQAWGNTPQQFEANQTGEKLLMAAQAWANSQGTDKAADAAIARYVGMPTLDPQTQLPQFKQDGTVWVLDRHPEALTWQYTLQSDCHEVIVLDTRTWRGYPIDQKAIAPPMLLCPTALKKLADSLQKTATDPNYANPSRRTFLIAPTNVFGLKVIDWIHHWYLRHHKVYATDVGDAWNIHTEALAQFLTILCQHRSQVIVLSGDIHYSSAVSLAYVTHQKTTPVADSTCRSTLLQLTASALKNEEALTRIIHTRLKDWLLPEKPRYWLGWNQPPDMLEVPKQVFRLPARFGSRQFQRSLANRDRPLPSKLPDWQCHLQWLRRHPLQPTSLGADLAWLLPANVSSSPTDWLAWLKFWRTRWFQDGREVVGVNNLALVQFEKLDPDDPETVIQDLYWISSWKPTQIVYSRYQQTL